MFPRDHYEYELSDYGLTFDWTIYEEERKYHIQASSHVYMLSNKSYVHEPTGAIRIREDCTRKNSPYRTIVGVLASKEVDENGLPKYRRLADMIVRDTSDENVRAVLEQEGLVAERWTYEGAWSWSWSSLPQRGRRRFLNAGYRVKDWVDELLTG